MDPTQDPALNPYAAIMARKAQLLAQEQQAMQPPVAPVAPMPPMGQQAQFSGYGMQRPQMQMVNGRPVTAQQLQQMAALLQNR